MRVGLVARAEDRGLGIQTWEVARHYPVDRVLVVNLGRLARGFVPHLDRYPGATVVDFVDGRLPEQVVTDWLDGLDVVYSAETFYDDRFVGWADDAGVATVLHVNPEFCRLERPTPTRVWLPTPWRAEHVQAAASAVGMRPTRVRIVPTPIPTDRFEPPPDPDDIGDRVTFLHVGGHPAASDRNGTGQVIAALPYVTAGNVTLRLAIQQRRLPRPIARTPVKVEAITRTVDDYWTLYGGCHALILPRRYGGLCLPALEAMGAGMALAMTDLSPQALVWPIVPIPAPTGGHVLRTAGGDLALPVVNPRDIATAIDRLADPAELAGYRARSLSYASEHSWAASVPKWESEFVAAVRGARG